MVSTKAWGIPSLPQHHVWYRRSQRIELWHFYQDFDQSRGVSAKIPKSQEWVEFWSPLPISASLVTVYRARGGLGRLGLFSRVLWGVKWAFSPLSWKLPIRYSQMFLQFRTLRCSRISPKKTNRWNSKNLNVLERSRLDPNDAFGMN